MALIPVLFTFDNNYVVPALVAFHSFLESVNQEYGHEYEFIICHDGITVRNQESINRLIQKYPFCRVRFMDMDGFLREEWTEEHFPLSKGRQFSKDTLYRCFASGLLPEYDIIIYSDVDVIFRKDISELFFWEMGDAYVGGVKIVYYENRHGELDHLQEPYFSLLKDKYLGGGIWIINSKKIRKDNIEQRMLEVIRDETIKKVWNDQDVINIACAGMVAHIPLRYISYADIKYILERDGAVLNYSKEEVYELFFDPTIIHYAGLKPWKLQSARLMDWWNEFDKIKIYVNDFSCYHAKREKKILFWIMRFLYKKLKLSRYF